VHGPSDVRGVVVQGVLDACGLGGADEVLCGPAQAGLQRHLARRSIQAGLGRVEHQLAGRGVVAVQLLARLQRLEGEAAFGGQLQQGLGAGGRGAAVAGAQELQAPGPLPRVGLQAKAQRRIGVQQQLGQAGPDARVGQGLHVRIAQLRAIAAAGAHGRLRRTLQHRDLVARLLQGVRRRQTHNARTHDTHMHVLFSLWSRL